MRDYEHDFVIRIKGLAISRSDFARITRETLRQILGEAGSSVVLDGMKKDVLKSPEKLAKELSSFFSTGAIPILKALVVGAIIDAQRPASGESQGEISVIPSTIEERYGISAVKRVYLHDHRVKDEMDEYFENLGKSKSDEPIGSHPS
jgi:hypothetical protein